MGDISLVTNEQGAKTERSFLLLQNDFLISTKGTAPFLYLETPEHTQLYLTSIPAIHRDCLSKG